MIRPKCRRCGMSLDLMPSLDEPGQWELTCNTLRRGVRFAKPDWSQSDETFQAAWDNLPGDEVVRLEKQEGIA